MQTCEMTKRLYVQNPDTDEIENSLFGRLRYSLLGSDGFFDIDTDSGSITLTKGLDYETTKDYKV